MKFEDFKKSFYSRVNDLSVFDTGEINLLKTVLDGLKVDYVKRGRVRVILWRSHVSINLFFFLQRLRAKLSGNSSGLREWLSGAGEKEYVLIDPAGRTIQYNGVAQSQYFANIIPVIGRDKAHIVAEGTKKSADDVDFIIKDYNLALAAELGSLNEDDKKLIARLGACYTEILEANIFEPEEMQNIDIALQQFFIRYRVWNRIARACRFKTAILWPHYHREGCIHALREQGTKIVELQHGLIAPQDIFYVLPDAAKSIAHKALFADEIWVYGEFWKQQLLKGAGYRADQIHVKGYFPFSAPVDAARLEELKRKYKGKQIILFTTQTFLAPYFCDYIRFLAKELAGQPFHLLVKLHPAEKTEEYASLHDLQNVEIIQENLETVFRLAKINISIYSTTLFDGLRYGVPGYAIWNERFSDYISFFRESGIIKVLRPDENPLSAAAVQEINNVEHYYARFNDQAVKQ